MRVRVGIWRMCWGMGRPAGGGIRRSNSKVGVRGRMRSSLSRPLYLTRLHLDRGCMIMRSERVGRGRRLCRFLLGC